MYVHQKYLEEFEKGILQGQQINLYNWYTLWQNLFPSTTPTSSKWISTRKLSYKSTYGSKLLCLMSLHFTITTQVLPQHKFRNGVILTQKALTSIYLTYQNILFAKVTNSKVQTSISQTTLFRISRAFIRVIESILD